MKILIKYIKNSHMKNRENESKWKETRDKIAVKGNKMWILLMGGKTMLKMMKDINENIKEPTKGDIEVIKSQLRGSQILEYAQEYHLTYEKAKEDLAEYIAWHLINE